MAANYGKQGTSYVELTMEQYSLSDKCGHMASSWPQNPLQIFPYKMDTVILIVGITTIEDCDAPSWSFEFCIELVNEFFWSKTT